MTSDNDNESRLISMKQASALTSMSRTLITALAREGRFPKPRLISERRIAFVRSEVNSWIDAQIASAPAA